MARCAREAITTVASCRASHFPTSATMASTILMAAAGSLSPAGSNAPTSPAAPITQSNLISPHNVKSPSSSSNLSIELGRDRHIISAVNHTATPEHTLINLFSLDRPYVPCFYPSVCNTLLPTCLLFFLHFPWTLYLCSSIHIK